METTNVKKFFLPMKIPTKTFQAKKLAVRNGKAVLYTPPELKEIESLYIALLERHKPSTPIEGAVILDLQWVFQDEKRAGQPKITKPDLDNLGKAFKDCMTTVGYWYDDCQIVETHEVKGYGIREGVYVEIQEVRDEE